MKVRKFKRILAVCYIVSAMVALHVQMRTALAQQSPSVAAGFGVGHGGTVSIVRRT
jgi:hypothetical protein